MNVRRQENMNITFEKENIKHSFEIEFSQMENLLKERMNEIGELKYRNSNLEFSLAQFKDCDHHLNNLRMQNNHLIEVIKEKDSQLFQNHNRNHNHKRQMPHSRSPSPLFYRNNHNHNLRNSYSEINNRSKFHY